MWVRTSSPDEGLIGLQHTIIHIADHLPALIQGNGFDAAIAVQVAQIGRIVENGAEFCGVWAAARQPAMAPAVPQKRNVRRDRTPACLKLLMTAPTVSRGNP